MALNEKLFFPKEIGCPVCTKTFKRYPLRKTQFSINRRDIDYRPIYLGEINPRLFAVCVCPHCYYAAEDKFFCPAMTDDDRRRKEYFATHKAQWETQNRVRAASSGQQIWKDAATEKLEVMTPEELAVLRKIAPLLQRSAANIIAKGRPINDLQKEGDFDTAIRSWELAAVCYKARRANHRILGYTYLSGAWTSRDCAEKTTDESKKEDYKNFEIAFLREAISFLTITNLATSIEDTFMPDGTRIVKENLPQTRIYEIMYILAGASRLIGDIETSNKFLEQIIFGGGSAEGIMLWFVKQARDMRQNDSALGIAPADDVPQDDSPPEES